MGGSGHQTARATMGKVDSSQPEPRMTTAMLERKFFRAFFAALVAEGITRINWRSDEADTRFRNVYDFLKKNAGATLEMQKLVNRLRPDPLSGSHPALHANLLHMQPGNVTAPNPGYEHVLLSAIPSDTTRFIGDLPSELRSLIWGAVKAFLTGATEADASTPGERSATDP